MSMVTNHSCAVCGCPLTLDCGDYSPDGLLDLTLECGNECGAPVLNAFVPFASFIPVDPA